MKCLHITEADVAGLLTIPDAVAALDDCFAAWPEARAGNMPRGRVRMPGGTFNLLGAAYEQKDVFGLKAYFASPHGARFHVMLYSARSGELLAMIDAALLGQIRTGAASAVATRLLAREDAATLAVIGTGAQAVSQIGGVLAVRPIRSIRVFSRSPEGRSAFAGRIERDFGVATAVADTAEHCVSGADIVVTITNSPEPVCRGEWLTPGTHLNAAGANAPHRRELDDAVILKADLLFTDSVPQARLEAGEFIGLVADGKLAWDDIHEIGDLASGRVAGRTTPRQVTLFKSLGIALEDVAVAELVYRRAQSGGAI